MGKTIQEIVTKRYTKGANIVQEDLCCPVSYDAQYLKIIPREVIEKDYGCGDPSQYIKEGETVLDLGSGTGKICFIAAQVVGPKGKVIGIDSTDKMLEVARRNTPIVAKKLGYENVFFKRGLIQDLMTDLDYMDHLLTEKPVTSAAEHMDFINNQNNYKYKKPLIPSNSIDIIVSNCVLNLVDDRQKNSLFHEIFRVLKPNGRIAISDIISDKVSPLHLKKDETLWGGCISGALQEQEFLQILKDIGFQDIILEKREEKPWKIIENIEYRSVTVLAWKRDLDKTQIVSGSATYKGPFQVVEDDRGNQYQRGVAKNITLDTISILKSSPYEHLFHMDIRANQNRESAQKKSNPRQKLTTQNKCC